MAKKENKAEVVINFAKPTIHQYGNDAKSKQGHIRS